ncbi:MAG: DUF4293 family protein [Saprospiraceae bacterium]|jgi:hypothetical protein|nr:DUF4293 family protein [Saprospiraceae bacterium]
MIQRIQSILLLLSGLGFLGQFATDFATSTQPLPQLLADQRYEVQDSPLLLILVIAGFLLSVAAVFLYQNRVLQMRITLLSLVSGILLPLLAYFLMYKEGSPIPAGVTVDDALGAYLPIVSIISSAVAIRFIKKDDQLVKSMDRLR